MGTESEQLVALAAEDTRRFRTHADWCQWLWTRGTLAVPHRQCRVNTTCMAQADRQLARRYEEAARGST